MTTAFEPIQGTARIELSDLVMYSLRLWLKRLAIWSVVVLAIMGFSLWRLFDLAVEPLRNLDPAETDAVMGSLREPLILLGLGYGSLFVLFLLLRVVVFPAIALWRIGRERRTLTWVVDETGIRGSDVLGAKTFLPWSNIQRVKFSRRMVWLRLKPRGWRYMLRRAFSSEDQGRLRELLARVVV